MKKTFILLLMLLLNGMTFAQVSTWDGTWEPWSHGTGTEEDPFLIENAQQLAYLAFRVNNGLDAGESHISNPDYHYKLMIDIDLDGSETFQWTPIGYWNSNTDYQCFGGFFDGNNHTISGMYINSSANRVGFFGNVDGVTISSISVSDGTIATSGQYAGGVVGYANGINIFNCNNCANVSTAFSTSSTTNISCAGGIAGIAITNNYDNIDNCYNNGTISSHTTGYNSNSSYAGGIVGSATTSINFTNCYNTGSISSINQGGHVNYSNTISGGIIGSGAHSILNCYNVGSVSASHSTSCYNCFSGGIIGSNSLQITNCYNIGDVSIVGGGNSNSGGIKGNTGGTVNNCYFLNTCGGNNTNGGQPMSSDAMRTAEFVTILNAGSLTYKQDTQPYVNDGYPIYSGFSIYTQPATSVSYTSAILNGSYTSDCYNVISQGFEYKKTTEQDYTIINCTAGQSHYVYDVRDLTHSTSYHYRAFVIVAEGSAYGELVEFTTPTLPSYTITASSSNGGNINPTGSITVYEGESKTFTITPDPGFEIAALVVDNDTIEPTPTYTFSNVTQNHTIAASFSEMTGPCLPPLNLIVNVIDATSVRMSWQGGADVYVIAYGTNDTYNHAASTSENSIVISDLLPQSSYVWKIKSVCGDLETEYIDGQPFITSGHGVGEDNSDVFSLWPNPAQETLNVIGENIEKIDVFNMQGQAVLSVSTNDVTTVLGVSNLNSGLYLVRITDVFGNSWLDKLIIM